MSHSTYIDGDGIEYFVYRLVGGEYGIYWSRPKLKPLPFLSVRYKTAALAQMRLDMIAAEMEWRRK